MKENKANKRLRTDDPPTPPVAPKTRTNLDDAGFASAFAAVEEEGEGSSATCAHSTRRRFSFPLASRCLLDVHLGVLLTRSEEEEDDPAGPFAQDRSCECCCKVGIAAGALLLETQHVALALADEDEAGLDERSPTLHRVAAAAAQSAAMTDHLVLANRFARSLGLVGHMLRCVYLTIITLLFGSALRSDGIRMWRTQLLHFGTSGYIQQLINAQGVNFIKCKSVKV